MFGPENHIFCVFILLRFYCKWPPVISGAFPFHYQIFFYSLVLCLQMNWSNSFEVNIIFLIHRRHLSEGMKTSRAIRYIFDTSFEVFV